MKKRWTLVVTAAVVLLAVAAWYGAGRLWQALLALHGH
jgi:hypothetical protein